MFLSFLSLGSIFVPSSVKFTGEQAMNLLWFLLFLPIFARVFWLGIAHALMPLRKEIGILMGTLALVHGMTFLKPDVTYILTSNFWIYKWYPTAYAYGFIALILTIPLLFTSNIASIKLLGKKWKMLHRLVYIVIIFTVIHVVALEFARHFEFGWIILLWIYFLGKILEWRGVSFAPKKTYPKWQKWLCVPCGYIYDPIIGDEDGGIPPWTEFIDIPDDWRCWVCGVRKSDFVPLDKKNLERKKYTGKIIQKKYLNPTTLELVVELDEVIKSIPWQFASFLWEDASWEFTRSYSIARHEWKMLTFLIKQNPLGRGGRILAEIWDNANICIWWIFGNFRLQDTANPKIFIATGTGLAPIYNMITTLRSSVIPDLIRDPAQPETTGFLHTQEWQKLPKITLYFSVATRDELFYRAELSSLANLDLKIHVTRENVEWLETGRVDVDTIDASPDTEWYLCGNPKMVSETKQKLSERGYQKIYTEAFS